MQRTTFKEMFMFAKNKARAIEELEEAYHTAKVDRSSAREGAYAAEFRRRSALEITMHAINLQQALRRNRFYEESGEFAELYCRIVEMQRVTEAAAKSAVAMYDRATRRFTNFLATSRESAI